MDWKLILGILGLFFSFMAFLFYIIRMHVNPIKTKVDGYIKKDEEFKEKVLDDLKDIKVQHLEQHSENLEKFVTKESFNIVVENLRKDKEKDISRVESEVKELKNDNKCE